MLVPTLTGAFVRGLGTATWGPSSGPADALQTGRSQEEQWKTWAEECLLLACFLLLQLLLMSGGPPCYPPSALPLAMDGTLGIAGGKVRSAPLSEHLEFSPSTETV